MSKSLQERYGPWALVTGASSGIGEAFANRLAADGVNLVIVARRLERLKGLAARLHAEHGVDVRPVQADLTDPTGIEAVEKAVTDVDIAIVVSNAGSAHPGAFLASPLDDRLDVVQLNVATQAELAHIFGHRLLQRGGGAFIFTGSSSAFTGVAMLANYAATKAYVGTLAEGLHGEWSPHGVDVQVVHPGPTRTEMVEKDGANFDRVPVKWMSADQVADASLNTVGRKVVLVPGAVNKFQRFMMTRLMSRRMASRVFGSLMRRITDDDRQLVAVG